MVCYCTAHVLLLLIAQTDSSQFHSMILHHAFFFFFFPSHQAGEGSITLLCAHAINIMFSPTCFTGNKYHVVHHIASHCIVPGVLSNTCTSFKFFFLFLFFFGVPIKAIYLAPKSNDLSVISTCWHFSYLEGVIDIILIVCWALHPGGGLL